MKTSVRRSEGWTEEGVREALDGARELNEAILWRSVTPMFRRASLGEVRMLTR